MFTETLFLHAKRKRIPNVNEIMFTIIILMKNAESKDYTRYYTLLKNLSAWCIMKIHRWLLDKIYIENMDPSYILLFWQIRISSKPIGFKTTIPSKLSINVSSRNMIKNAGLNVIDAITICIWIYINEYLFLDIFSVLLRSNNDFLVDWIHFLSCSI